MNPSRNCGIPAIPMGFYQRNPILKKHRKNSKKLRAIANKFSFIVFSTGHSGDDGNSVQLTFVAF
jgi:hypothetical protein